MDSLWKGIAQQGASHVVCVFAGLIIQRIIVCFLNEAMYGYRIAIIVDAYQRIVQQLRFGIFVAVER